MHLNPWNYKTWQRPHQQSFSRRAINWKTVYGKWRKPWSVNQEHHQFSTKLSLKHLLKFLLYLKQFCSGVKQNMLVLHPFQKMRLKQPPAWIFAGAACSFSWEENGISNQQVFE